MKRKIAYVIAVISIAISSPASAQSEPSYFIRGVPRRPSPWEVMTLKQLEYNKLVEFLGSGKLIDQNHAEFFFKNDSLNTVHHFVTELKPDIAGSRIEQRPMGVEVLVSGRVSYSYRIIEKGSVEFECGCIRGTPKPEEYQHYAEIISVVRQLIIKSQQQLASTR